MTSKETASAPIDPLVAAVIHDAKNALMTLDTQLAEAQRRPASADFSAARSQVSRIAAQLTELLTLYRAQNGVLRLAIDDHDLMDFVEDLLAEIGQLPATLTLDCNTGNATQYGAWAFDAQLVKLVLLDALRNALRHATRHVMLNLSMAGTDGICFSITDDGPGFPAEVLGDALVASTEGTGLGLSFARLIAVRHATPDGRHGRIELSNAPAAGACFKLILP
jgi:signal transduction histidine kinase